jgi:hypothetical protein
MIFTATLESMRVGECVAFLSLSFLFLSYFLNNDLSKDLSMLGYVNLEECSISQFF